MFRGNAVLALAVERAFVDSENLQRTCRELADLVVLLDERWQLELLT